MVEHLNRVDPHYGIGLHWRQLGRRPPSLRMSRLQAHGGVDLGCEGGVVGTLWWAIASQMNSSSLGIIWQGCWIWLGRWSWQWLDWKKTSDDKDSYYELWAKACTATSSAANGISPHPHCTIGKWSIWDTDTRDACRNVASQASSQWAGRDSQAEAVYRWRELRKSWARASFNGALGCRSFS